jgi:hypothetical protein
MKMIPHFIATRPNGPVYFNDDLATTVIFLQIGHSKNKASKSRMN